MPLLEMCELCNLGEDRQEPRENEDPLEAELFWAMEEDELSISSSSSSLSVFSDISEEVAAAETPSPPPSPPGACPSPEALEAPPLSETQGVGSSSQDEEQQSTTAAPEDAESSRKQAAHLMMAELVKFLLEKYRAKEPTTQAEMLSSVFTEHQDHFPEIFSRASDYLQLVFGVDMLEVDPINHTYVLLNSLGLTRDEVASDGHGMPKTGLLVMLLSNISMQGGCAPEHKVWEALNNIGVHDGVEHYIYGEPRELITKVWVEEQYVVYRQVADSDPARYEFLWGPRAHAETTHLRVLQFLFKVSLRHAIFTPSQPLEVKSDEEEGA